MSARGQTAATLGRATPAAGDTLNEVPVTDQPASVTARRSTLLDRFLNIVEKSGNKLPDPAVLFLIAMLLVWAFSALLAPVQFTEIDPRNGQPIRVNNLLTGTALATFLATMVNVFVTFPPLGVVLVAMLGVGVAESVGFLNAGLKWMLNLTPRALLTPMLITVACLSHTATDAGYVLVIPLGGVIFYTAGRHPLAGIAAAFAGVSGGFSANIIPSGIDPLLQGFTQSGAQLIDPARLVNPLCNWFFMGAASVLVIGCCWWLTDRVVEPRLLRLHPVAASAAPPAVGIGARERRGLRWAGLGLALALMVLALAAAPADSPLRDPASGGLTTAGAPLMHAIVPLIFLLFLVPGLCYGAAAGTLRSHRDVVAGMTRSMATMGHYIVMAFFAAQFIAAFSHSNLGVLLAASGAGTLRQLALPPQWTVLGVILLTTSINLFIGSASAKWLLLAPVLVPLLMQLGIAPELTQAAYRVGDSSTNIITPLMPYFPLIVAFCRRYLGSAGIGTLAAMMLPYSALLLTGWSLLLLAFWALGLPLGIQAGYRYPPG